MKRFLIPSCFAFLLISASILNAQQYGRIMGEVHAPRIDFPGRIFIELQLHGSPINSQYTDEQGKFSFEMLGSNVYHVVIRDEHFVPVDERVMLDLSVNSLSIVQINLIPRQQSRQPSRVDRSKGKNPYIVDSQEYRRRFPKKALKEFDKGLKSDRDAKFDEAIGHYRKAIEIAPDFYPAHNNLGSDYVGKADFKAAQAQFEEAIRLNQSDSEAHLNLANVFLQTKNYDDALKNVQEGLQREPQSAFGQFVLGSIYERTGKAEEAEHALRQALTLDPGMSRIRLELVNLYLAQKKPLEATTELKAFLQNSPADPLAPKARALLLRLESPR